MAIQNVYSGDRTRLYALWPLYFLSSRVRHFNSTFGQVFRATSNWWSAIFLFFGLAESATIHYKNGIDLRATKKDLGKAVSLAEFANIPEREKKRIGLRVDGEYATMLVGKKRIRVELEVANAVAIELYTKEHSMIDVRNKKVVDIGAYVDNTAIYYALVLGAKHVYAFEPYPYIYRTAVRCVKANGLDKQITTYNVAVSGVSGSASLDQDFTSFGMVDASPSSRGKGGIKVVSLDSVVKSLGIKKGALKVDCEGCEYSIFKRASSRALKAFDAIHVEYHYGYKDIVERLRAEGFRVSYTKPIYNFRGFGSEPMLNGDIIAIRKE
jgi:FkbM family methyltransferase